VGRTFPAGSSRTGGGAIALGGGPASVAPWRPCGKLPACPKAL
jgi:hypothetical protein